MSMRAMLQNMFKMQHTKECHFKMNNDLHFIVLKDDKINR